MAIPTVPFLRFEMENIKTSVMHHFQDHHNELGKLVNETIAETLNEQWLHNEVKLNVERCLRSAIQDLGSSRALQLRLTDIMEQEIDKLLSAAKGEG